jgi:hypothetical protein
MTAPLALAVMANAELLLGVEAVKVNEAPPPTLVSAMEAALLDDAEKSVATPVVAPEEPDTLIVHVMLPPAR